MARQLDGLVRAMVDDATSLEIRTEHGSNGQTRFIVFISASERGKLIGRGGQNIQALRRIFRAIGKKGDLFVFIDIDESIGGPG